MTIAAVNELHRGRIYSGGEKFVQTFERTWQIRTTSSADDQFYVANNSGLPLPYSPYPNFPFALRLGLDVRPTGDESGILWEAHAIYSTQYDTPQQDSNPLNRPVLYSGNQSRFTLPAFKRTDNGKAILNLANDLYDPPLMLDDDRMGLQFMRNEAYPPIAAMRAYRRAISSDSFQGDAPKTWKVVSITFGNQQFENGVTFFQVTYTFEYNPDTWEASVLEQGYNGINAAGKPVSFEKDTPQLLIKPVAGNNLVRAMTKDEIAAGQFTFTKQPIYNPVPFSTLGLPTL